LLFLVVIRAPLRQELPVQKGFSHGIARMMTTVTHTLATELQAELALTQSDELTILIPPTFKTKGSNVIFNPHAHGGRHDKLITLASSRASELARQIIDRKIASKFFFTRFSNRFLSNNNFSIQFDARMGVWKSKRDALQLLLWRAYDCSVNGVSDAIHCFNPKLSGMGTVDKLDWLNQQGLLPLPSHQAYGTLFQRQIVSRRAWNPKDRVWVIKQKSELTHPPHDNLVVYLLDMTDA
jgi:tRNA(His) 5'-end guanylyltransferase